MFGDSEIAGKILATNLPEEHVRLGHEVRKFDSKIWKENHEGIVKKGNIEKVCHAFTLSKQLLIACSSFSEISKDYVKH